MHSKCYLKIDKLTIKTAQKFIFDNSPVPRVYSTDSKPKIEKLYHVSKLSFCVNVDYFELNPEKSVVSSEP